MNKLYINKTKSCARFIGNRITILNIISCILYSIIVKIKVNKIYILLILISYNNIVDFARKNKKTFARSLKNLF